MRISVRSSADHRTRTPTAFQGFHTRPRHRREGGALPAAWLERRVTRARVRPRCLGYGEERILPGWAIQVTGGTLSCLMRGGRDGEGILTFFPLAPSSAREGHHWSAFTPGAKDRLTLEQMRLSRNPTPRRTSRLALE